jgi:5-methylcytosine-specific restriction endonuclease McrA
MAGSPYSTARWQKLRRYILERDGGLCQIRGPRCTGYATTVDHRYPSSTHPELFWAEENLRASCKKCNYGSGSRIASESKRATIAKLRETVAEQDQTITEMVARIIELEAAQADNHRAQPAIR